MRIILNDNVTGSNIIDTNTISSITDNNNCCYFEDLKQLVTKIEADLENAKNIEVDKSRFLKEQTTLLKKSIEEKNETSAIDLLKNIATGAISSGIWSVGSMVSSYISSIMG